MKKFKLIVAAVLAAVMVTTGAVVANSANDSTHQAPGTIAALRSTSTTALKVRDRSWFNDHAERAASAGDSIDLDGFDSGRSLIDYAGIRLAAIATGDGGVCFVADKGIDAALVQCYPAFLPWGIAPTVETPADAPWVIYGLAADGVTAIDVRHSDGGRERVMLKNNAFVWSGKGDVNAILVTMGGTVKEMPIEDFNITDLDIRQVDA